MSNPQTNGYGSSPSGSRIITIKKRKSLDQDSASSSSPSSSSSLLVPKQVNNHTVAHQDMCYYCFDALHAHLHRKSPFSSSPSSLKSSSPSFTNAAFPLFVTWKIGTDQRLRGCIGTFNPTPLHAGLKDYAITAAVRDSRFDPITKDEFDQLHVCVSLLLNFEDGDHYQDWTVGVHGIRIEFRTESGSKRNATYLPEVAHEHGWDHVSTIDSLLRKGGFRGPITEDVRREVRLTRYQSEKISVSYRDYYHGWLMHNAK